MGDSCLETPQLIHDLRVRVRRFSTVKPLQKSERKTMFLSNIDQALNFNVETLHFFEANAEYGVEKVVERIENAVRKLLGVYDFLAGRLRADPGTGRLEVDCNGAGAGFVVAESELRLDEIGSLAYPNPAFGQLIQESAFVDPDNEDRPHFILQVTTFKCGGFAMSTSENHTLMDGLSYKMFLENLASLAADKPLAVVPCNDRTLLAGRSPPRVAFSHPELIEIPQIQGQDQNSELFQTSLDENLEFKVFNLSARDIMKLRKQATQGNGSTEAKNIKITSFNVVMAHIWRCKVLTSSAESSDSAELSPDRISTILYAVDIRSRLGPPPFPQSYTGNAVVTAYGKAKLSEFAEKPFSHLVKMITEGTNRVTDEYVRSVIDWGELHKGFPYGDVLVSSWWRLGFNEVTYPWGRPKYCCPLVHQRKDIVLLFPDIGEGDKGVNVLVAMEREQMKVFEEMFVRLLGQV